MKRADDHDRSADATPPSGIRWWAVLAIVGIVVLFTLQNIVTVQVTFLLWTMELPRALLLFIVFSLGMLVGYVVKSTHTNARRH